MKGKAASLGVGWIFLHSLVIGSDLDSSPRIDYSTKDSQVFVFARATFGGLERARIIYDFDGDGWCDLWCSMFPELANRDVSCDTDGDGVSDYVEMLWWRNPIVATPAPHLLSVSEKAEFEEEREREYAAWRLRSRKLDQDKLHHFFANLASMRSVSELDSERMGISLLLEGDAPPAPNGPSNPSGSSSQICITGIERLSTGDVLLQWVGEEDCVYSVEFSDDPQDWQLGMQNLPTIGGVGEWMDSFISGERRFYRIVAEHQTTPSDPSGGDGISTFGGLLQVNLAQQSGVATVMVNLPGGIQPSSVKLIVDGRKVSMLESYVPDTYQGVFQTEWLRNGLHSAYAIIDATFDTTPTIGELDLASPGLLRTPTVTFSTDLLIHNFQVSENDIDSQDPNKPDHTEISAIIEQEGSEDHYELIISDENGHTVQQWQEDLRDTGPTEISLQWDGTAQDGSSLPFGTYTVDLSVYGQGFIETHPILVRVGEPPYKALIISEAMKGVEKGLWTADQEETYRPEWAPFFLSSSVTGFASDPNMIAKEAWGPWPDVKSMTIVDQNILDILGGEENKWSVRLWDSGNKNHTPNDLELVIPEGFETGNPFNDYHLGMLIGHGVASSGGQYEIDGVQKQLPPQSYFPIINNQSTKETFWIKSGQMAKTYGADGDLNWMFLLTCNPLRVGAHDGSNEHDIYRPMKTAGTLPIGENLHILCGYTTKIIIENKLGTELSRSLLQQPDGVTTVIDAWLYTRDKTGNFPTKSARAVCWPECVNDTIYGVPNEDVKDPAPGQPQTNLLERDSEPL